MDDPTDPTPAEVTFVPPSQQSCQGPVPKPGEPVRPTKGILAEPKVKAKAEAAGIKKVTAFTRT